MEIFKVRPEEKRIFIINGSGGCGKDTFVEQVNIIPPAKVELLNQVS